jgi:hypothetical protein
VRQVKKLSKQVKEITESESEEAFLYERRKSLLLIWKENHQKFWLQVTPRQPKQPTSIAEICQLIEKSESVKEQCTIQTTFLCYALHLWKARHTGSVPKHIIVEIFGKVSKHYRRKVNSWCNIGNKVAEISDRLAGPETFFFISEVQ